MLGAPSGTRAAFAMKIFHFTVPRGMPRAVAISQLLAVSQHHDLAFVGLSICIRRGKSDCLSIAPASTRSSLRTECGVKPTVSIFRLRWRKC
jgi:hypothetical protein